VQFFESLFSNQPGQCRKLHNIARSVVILDECQTLPPGLVGPTCSMLRGLAEFAGTSIVLCTATQPAWHRRDDLQTGLEGVREIVSAELNLFEKLRRVRVRWPKRDETPLDWPAVAALMRDQSSLCIVNTKKAALAVFEQLRVQGCRNVFHLSTNMCPAHRLEVLDEVRRRLKEQEPCRLVSTQLIEAGVDVDFPLLLREMAPLEAIVQSAGRCNREGLLNSPDGSPGGQVVVFRSVEGKLPTNRWYSAGRDTLEQDFIRAGREPDVASTADMQEYFRRLYRTGELDSLAIEDLRRRQQFETIWKGDRDRPGVGRYRLIDDFTVSVVAATWTPHRAQIEDLLTKLRFAPSRRLFRQLAGFQVNLQPHQLRQSAGLIIPHECGGQVWQGKYDNALGVLFEPEEWDNIQ
jgi:CRISPR-associated endonuclease/helicase Cas3